MGWLDVIGGHGWALYLGLALTPFVQEDAAVFAAAGAAAANLGPDAAVFGVALVGLTVSDAWKYWAGRYAATHAWARRWIEKPKATAARQKVLKHLAAAMFTARFVPGTRVPLYLAAGAFKAPFWPFLFYVIASGALYLGVAFGLVHVLGMVVGHQAAAWFPVVAIGAALTFFGGRAVMRSIRRRAALALDATVHAEQPR